MSFWDDIGKKVAQGTKIISQKSGEVFEITKVKLDIAAEKDKMAKLFEEIGRTIYENYKSDNLKSTDVVDKCQLIEEIEYKIKKLNQKVAQIKGGSLCRVCGEVVSSSQRYCHHCGRELEKSSRVIEDRDGYKVEVSNGEVCNDCGTLNQKGAEYCSACGKKL
jgi:hypothetical protein